MLLIEPHITMTPSLRFAETSLSPVMAVEPVSPAVSVPRQSGPVPVIVAETPDSLPIVPQVEDRAGEQLEAMLEYWLDHGYSVDDIRQMTPEHLGDADHRVLLEMIAAIQNDLWMRDRPFRKRGR